MRITDPDALESWRRLKKIIFSTLFVVLAVPVFCAGAIAVSAEIRLVLASFGFFFHYHLPEAVHKADLLAIVITLLIVIVFSVFVVIKDVVIAVLPEKHEEHVTPTAHAHAQAALPEPKQEDGFEGNQDGAIGACESEEITGAASKEQSLLVLGIRKPNTNMSRRRRRRLKSAQDRKNRRKRS